VTATPSPDADAPEASEAPRVPLTARPRVMLALVLLATALVFLPALGGEFVWDDVPLIRTNPNVRDLSRLGEALTHDFWHTPERLESGGSLARRYYRPVITLAYALQFRAFGEAPAGYHLVNLALHLTCTGLVLAWLRRRIPAPDHPAGPVAWVLGAAVFAVHPSRPETVAWISGSTDLWFALFALLGFWAWDRRRDLWGAALAAGCFFLAALCKETAVVLPLLLAVDRVLLRDRASPWRPDLARVTVAASGVALAFGLRVTLVPHLVAITQHEPWARTPARVLSSLGYYLADVVAPWWPSVHASLRAFVHNQPVYPPWTVALGALGALCLGGLGVAAWRRPGLRPWCADALWFLVALGPTLNVVPMGMTVLTAPRFLYLPLLGVCALVTRAAVTARGTRGDALRAAFGALTLGFAVVCSQHAAHFADRHTLWTAELQRNPRNYYALGELATDALERGDLPAVGPLLSRGYGAAVQYGVGDEAVRFMLKSVQFLLWTTPDDDVATLTAVRDFLDAFVTAASGTARLHTRQFQIEAPLPRHERPLRQGLHLEHFRAWAYFRTDDLATAETELRAAATRPHAYGARRYLAMVLMARQRWPEARTIVDALLAETPSDPDAARLRAQCEGYPAALRDAPDAVARTSLEARLWTDLTRASRARALLAPLLRDHPTRVEPLAARIYAELSDRRPAVAEALVQEASTRHPDRAADFRAALQRGGR